MCDTNKKVQKIVYFNPANKRELELIVWLENKFSSFGGLTKDLLYREMIRERQGIPSISVDFQEYKDNKDYEYQNVYDLRLDPSDVEDYDC